MSIKIIGAGFPRTGTNTLKESLEKLGYIKTYHMKELLVQPQHLQHWITLRETGTTNWDELYNGYQATVDFPAYPWYKEHMKRYPDAKVILTVRPFEKWHDSVYSTIWQAQNPSEEQKKEMGQKIAANPGLVETIKCVEFAKDVIMGDHFEGKFLDKVFAEKVFNQHIEEVKAYVPADKLLVFDVSEGWGPLCNFLEVAEPAEPLPHTNKKENFKEMLGQLMKGQMA
ncbi:sulfotransferase family protein [Segetibacter aerophilus]|uniref:Sulfotransferase family protein n=1 Tax=Segetibacter aerophilus TaxID=670293 RepID=A0A512BDY3_9BACT|nr:sulfotransferase family protein [Segetibacter aerophilus]GEO10095.1 sulfotransferase family protein [Segetibacter aerophilus]